MESHTNVSISKSHYTNEHLEKQERQLMESKDNVVLCCEFKITQKELEMIDIIKNITVSHLNELNEILPTHMQSVRSSTWRGWRDISGQFILSNNCEENHKCECKLIITLKNIKPSKTAKKTIILRVPDPKWTYVYIDHCECHWTGFRKSDVLSYQTRKI